MRACFVLAALWIGVIAHAQPGGDTERTPFTELRFTDEGPRITVEGEWYLWRGIDGVSYDDLAEFAFEKDGDDWRELVSEDLVWLLTEMGQAPGERVDLLVEPMGGGPQSTLIGVPMTNANRNQAMRWIDDNIDLYRLTLSARARDGLVHPRAALDELGQIVARKHSYATFRGRSLDDLVAHELESLGDAPKWPEVVLGAQRIVCALGDGHASVGGWDDAAPGGYLPVLLESAEGGVVAFHDDRSGFVDADRPYVTAIDGRPIGDWIDAVSVYVADGSAQLVEQRSLRMLRWVNLARDELGMPRDETVTLTLADASGAEAEAELPIAPYRPIYGDWPRTQTRVLGSGIGYFRLPSMSPSREFVLEGARAGVPLGEIDASWLRSVGDEFDSLSACPAVIIDVRGNGGGDRGPTTLIMKRIMDAGSEPVVVNASRLRLGANQPAAPEESSLDDRDLYPAAWDGWSPDERAAIAAFAEGFEPEWSPPAGQFSDWHYMVVSPDETSPAVARPVVVLIDAGCFSATDVFAGALGELPNVTLVGQATSGGSARVRSYELEQLGLKVYLGSMISYQPSGLLYDGNGVRPDVVVEPLATDLIGKTDRVLEEAEALLLRGQ